MRGFLSDILWSNSRSRSNSKAAGDEQGKGNETEPKGKEVLLGEHIDALGFGWYQIQVWILCSGFIIAEGAEVQMASGLVSAMQEEFSVVSEVGKAMLMTWTFIGFALGTVASGPLGDNLGRRHPMILGYCGVIVTASFTTLVGSLNLLYGMRLILGFFAGIGVPTACIAISEVTPSKLRGKATGALIFAYILGELWAGCGLLIMMPDLVHGSWRLLIAWAMIPAVCLMLFGMVSPVARQDTPFFLGSRGKSKELHELVNLIAEMNGTPELKLGDKDTVFCHVPEKIHFSAVLPTLFSPPLISSVLVMMFMFFAKDFAFFGTDVFWPQVWAKVPGIRSLSPAQELLLTAFLGVPGGVLATYLMDHLPRKTGLTFCAAACGICTLAIRGLHNGKARAFLGVFGFKLLLPTWQMTTMLLPSELFGTQIRTWGFACASTVGRFATMLCPFAVGRGTDGFTGILASLAFGAAIMVHLLPETKDCELTENVINTIPSTSISQKLLMSESASETQTASYGAAATSKV